MDDRPRQVPQEQPGLRLRQQGNFISVRQKPDQDAGWGTLRQPKRFELPLLTPHRLKSHLGYEAVPASEFWQFSVSGRVRLQVNRLSADRYANSVGVALLDQANRRVAPLVQSASGRGEPVEIGPGTYKVVASLGIAENIKDLIFEFNATPAGGVLRAIGGGVGASRGQLRESGRGSLRGGSAWTVLASARQQQLQLQGLAVGSALGDARVLTPSRLLCAAATAAVSGSGLLRATAVAGLRGSSRLGPVSGHGMLRIVHWLNEPHGNWRARVNSGVVELNRSYVNFAADPLTQQQLLLQLAAALTQP